MARHLTCIDGYLQAFLGMNFALTGIPLGLFVLFTLTVAIFSLVVGIVLGLLAAVAFTVFAVGVALTIVLPTVFFTTMTACFLFLWGLGGYYILQWGNKAGKGEGAKEDSGPAIGDRLNSLTGGRLSGFMGAAKSEQAKGDMSGWSDEHTKPNAGSGGQQGEKKQQLHSQPQTNGVPKVNGGTPKKQVDNAAHKATKATGVDGAHKTAANGVGTVKGGVSGATGLG